MLSFLHQHIYQLHQPFFHRLFYRSLFQLFHQRVLEYLTESTSPVMCVAGPVGPGENVVGRMPMGKIKLCAVSPRPRSMLPTAPPTPPRSCASDSDDDLFEDYLAHGRHHEPDEFEKLTYYGNLPGRPRLVARTGTKPHPRPRPFRAGGGVAVGSSDDATRERLAAEAGKRMLQMRAHNIFNVWEIMVEDLARVLQKLRLQWTGIDVFRMGYEDEDEDEEDEDEEEEEGLEDPTVVVSVRPRSTSWRRGIEAALACKHVLYCYGVDNRVECEVRETDPRGVEEEWKYY